VPEHVVVDLGAVNPAVFSRLADGQPRGKYHGLIVGWQESTRHRKLALPVLPGSIHDSLRSPVVDPRCLGRIIHRGTLHPRPRAPFAVWWGYCGWG
jgi:hypothetical protein